MKVAFLPRNALRPSRYREQKTTALGFRRSLSIAPPPVVLVPGEKILSLQAMIHSRQSDGRNEHDRFCYDNDENGCWTAVWVVALGC